MSKDKENIPVGDYGEEAEYENYHKLRSTDTTKPKIVEFDKPDPNAKLYEELKRNLPYILARLPMIAQMRRAYFLEYVKAGFTEEQALKLCVQ